MEYRFQILKGNKYLALVLLMLCSYSIKAQDGFNLELNMLRTKHGTGDMLGFSFNTNFVKPIKKNLSYVISVGGTTHQQKDELFFTVNGRENDGSIVDVTSGFQIGYGLDYKLINSKNHKLGIRLVAFGRYQSTSLPDSRSILYPIITDVPFPVIYFGRTSPAQTFAAGLDTSLIYNIRVYKSFSLNLLGSFQFDTNGDNIIGYGAGIVKSF